MSFAAGSYIWIPDETEVVIPAKVETSFSPGSAGKVTRLDTNKTVKLSASDTKGLTQMHEQSVDGLDDMVGFKELDEFSILYNLRMRFEQDIIYTNIGRILTSVNPFKLLPIYSPGTMDEYMENGSRKMPPHVYGVADDAFNAMIDNERSQSCIVSGESGAGKTEATKVFLQYISEKSKRKNQSGGEGTKLEMQQRILESNPLMEAFGNAKTVRNDNSSRFGKWIEVQFNRRAGSIEGGSIKSYLLEKSRIVSQAENERNYHIFYQFCAAAAVNPELAKYNIADATQYHYLNQSENPCTTVESIDDIQDWLATLTAMEKIGISQEEKDNVLNVINIVLNVGNVNFTGKDTAAVDNKPQLEKTAGLIGCSPEALEKALIKVDRGTPADPDLVGNFDVGQAYDARDAFAKHLYALQFDWLIRKINLSLGRVPDKPEISTIGVLDIFGFEFFENNSFEQLCINYCNERLQGHFNDHIFKLEQEQYAKEGIDVTKIDFEDNSHVIQTIDSKKGGILQVIANELKLRQATDEKLLGKLKKIADETKGKPLCVLSYPSNKEIKQNEGLELTFRVKHYAGVVTYRIEQFLEKNRDTMPSLLIKLGKACKTKYIKDLFKDSSASKKKALGLRFSTQLADLMKDLSVTEPHYIRCVKPNSNKVREEFTSTMVLDQLRYAGLLEVCRIRQMGYPVRRTHDDFLKRYRHLADGKVSDHVALIAALTKQGLANDTGLQVGTTKVFLKTGISDSLEEERAISLSKWVKEMQRVVRGFLVRLVSKNWGKTRQGMRDAIKSRNKDLLKTAVLSFGSLPYGGRHLEEYKTGRELLNKIEDEERISELLKDAMASRDKDQIEAALKAAEEKNLGNTKEAKDAKMLVELIERENVCKASLRAAIEAKDEAKLKQAVTLANSLSLGKSLLCKDAQHLIEMIEKERVCRKNLQAALDSKDVANTKKFMNQMADMGKANDPLVKQGEELVQETAKVAAEIESRTEALLFALQKAIRVKNLKKLDELEAEIIDLGIDNDITKKARETRDLLQKEKEICAKLSAESTAANAKAQTRAGLVLSDLEGLRTLIKEAEQILDGDDFQLLSAQDDLRKLENQLDVQSQLQSKVAEYKAKKAVLMKETNVEKRNEIEAEILKMLKDANETAVDSGAEIEAAQEIKEKLNQFRLEVEERHKKEREAQKAENIAKLQESTEEDREELEAKRMGMFTDVLSEKHRARVDEAADNQRYGLPRYYRLRSDEDYVEKVPDELKLPAAHAKLFSQSKPIMKSLCRLERRENEVAIRINKSILQYCGDLNVNFPATLAQFMLMRGLEDAGMTDEIYIQLMKHISGNPKPESADRAWLLMCMATKTFPPPSEFTPFLLNFFIQRRKMPGLVGNYARLCIVQLDATIELGPTFFKPSIEEIQNYRKRPPILASIHTLDGKKFEYPVTPDMRVTQVLELLKKKLEVEEDAEQPVWGIYVSPEEEQDIDSPRQRLIRFYQFYNPSKLAHVDLFLDHWKGNPEELFQKLIHKYGPEPAEDEKIKKKGVLALPITAAMHAVKFLGFSTQKEQPPAPQCSWPLPWWTHLGDVYYRMSRQKKVPRFTFKRRMITRKEPVDKWLYYQAVEDVRNGFLPIKDDKMIAHLTALSLIYENGAVKDTSAPALKDIGVMRYIPNESLTRVPEAVMVNEVGTVLKTKQLPSAQNQIMEAYLASVRQLPVYGMNYFYARHSASDKNYVIAVDVEGIHVLEEDRSAVKRSFVFDTIKKFGATAEYFWMNIDERQDPEKPGKFRFLSQNQGINVLLYTLQSWEMYDCVYDATHIGVEEE